MLINLRNIRLLLVIALFSAGALTGCNFIKKETKTATLLKTEDASLSELKAEVDRFAQVDSLRAQMDLKFEDNSFAQFGNKEVYRAADGEVVVQRPASILLMVRVPLIKTDVARMASDGEHFQVAVLNAGSCSSCKKFVIGTNNADYSSLQNDLSSGNGALSGEIRQNVNAFANLRPQHFTDAMLVRPIDEASFIYTVSTIFQIEEDETASKKSALRKVNRGYYLLDEYTRNGDGSLKISRRFWFDRIGDIRLARQQIFDRAGEIESDIMYGAEGRLTETANFDRLPLQIIVTRPREKYAMKLTYQVPENVQIGNKFPASAFILQNSWGLEQVDLDKKLKEVSAQKPGDPAPANRNSTTRFH
ncbi:MAG TPA: hypothetical protein PKD26_07465 [Pyrinomonadaceae bacterium]|nr:hypothetical protein [Pyrinomonadaceae bacterium]